MTLCITKESYIYIYTLYNFCWHYFYLDRSGRAEKEQGIPALLSGRVMKSRVIEHARHSPTHRTRLL